MTVQTCREIVIASAARQSRWHRGARWDRHCCYGVEIATAEAPRDDKRYFEKALGVERPGLTGRAGDGSGWGVVAGGKGVGGATFEAIHRVVGVGRVGRQADGDAQLTDVFGAGEGRQTSGTVAEAVDDIAHPGLVTVAVDGGFDVVDQTIHAAVHPQQGEAAPAGVEGVEPLRDQGMHLTEGLDVPVGKATGVDSRVERGHQLTSGGMAQADVDRGRRCGVAGGAAQGVGGMVGPLGANVQEPVIEVFAALVAVVFHCSDGEGSFFVGWGLRREAGFQIVVSTRPGIRNYLAYFFVYSGC